MTNAPDDRLGALEQKVDALAASFDARFDAVDVAFAEQRQYTEFAFERLRTEMMARFEQVDARFEQIDARFDRVDSRFDRLERKLDGFIETQSRANELAERRLRRLEGLI